MIAKCPIGLDDASLVAHIALGGATQRLILSVVDSPQDDIVASLAQHVKRTVLDLI